MATIIVELYDPASGTWSTVSPLNRDHDEHTTTLLPSGDVLVVGGEQGQFPPSSVAEASPRSPERHVDNPHQRFPGPVWPYGNLVAQRKSIGNGGRQRHPPHEHPRHRV